MSSMVVEQSEFLPQFTLLLVAWLSCAAIVVAMTCYAARHLDWRRLWAVFTEEDGAAYTLSYVMVTPIYTLFVCLVVEVTFMMIAHIGTVYSAFAAARTAIVWNTATSEAEAAQKVRAVAVRSFIPFASGLAKVNNPGAPSNAVNSAWDAYSSYAKDQGFEPGSEKYIRAKCLYAERAVSVATAISPRGGSEPWDEDISATVTYRFPFSVPLVGRIFGTLDANGQYTYSMSSKVVLQNEAPQNNEKKLGISYASAK